MEKMKLVDFLFLLPFHHCGDKCVRKFGPIFIETDFIVMWFDVFTCFDGFDLFPSSRSFSLSDTKLGRFSFRPFLRYLPHFKWICITLLGDFLTVLRFGRKKEAFGTNKRENDKLQLKWSKTRLPLKDEILMKHGNCMNLFRMILGLTRIHIHKC